MREALIKSFNPTIASMAVMGLVALPGTMTGQILGGSSPNVAIKYQIMLMITIFSSSLIYFGQLNAVRSIAGGLKDSEDTIVSVFGRMK